MQTVTAFYDLMFNLELTRFRGHLTLWGGDCPDATTPSQLPT